MRSVPGSAPTSSRNGRFGGGATAMSPGPGPFVASSMAAVSRVVQRFHSVVLWVAGTVGVKILDEQRHTAERPVGQWCLRFGARLVEAPMDHRVELRIELLDAGDRVVDELER